MNDDVLEGAARWLEEGRRVALATVVATWGSSPRPMGSQLAVDADGRFIGSVSGGCVEAAVVHEAAAVILAGSARLLQFAVGNESAWEVGLACGGRVEIFVERLQQGAWFDALIDARRAGIACVLATRLRDGAQCLLLPDRVEGDLELDSAARERARDALRADRSTVLEAADGRIFCNVFAPPCRLIVVGAVHIAEPLIRMAAATGYAVVLIDPRQAFARREGFAGVTVLGDWPDAALVALAPDARTAVVTLTHDPKLDDPALQVALASGAFYIGCLGSRKTHAARLGRLRRAGLAEDALARVHGPVGLAIGAQTPAEIAISILAEITRVRRLGEHRPASVE